MFNLNLPENLKTFLQILDPENKHEIKDMRTAIDFLMEITEQNKPENNINLKDIGPVNSEK